MASEIIRGRLVVFAATLAEWTLVNPIVRAAEIVAEIGTPGITKMKIGDGITDYLALPYVFGGGGGGTGTLQAVTDAGADTTNTIIIGDTASVTGSIISDTGLNITDAGTTMIGMQRGGGPVKDKFFIIDRISGFLTEIVAQENFSGGDVELTLPNETGEFALLAGTKEITIAQSFFTAKFNAAEIEISRAGTTLAGFGTTGTAGVILLRATLGTNVDQIQSGNLSSTARTFKTPVTAAGVGGDFALRGNSTTPTVVLGPATVPLDATISFLTPSDDNSGTVRITIGVSSPVLDIHPLFIVTFANPYDRIPNVVLTYGNLSAAESGLLIVTSVTTLGFTVRLRSAAIFPGFTSAVPGDHYDYRYIVMR
jgi:hypothetical protein